MLNALVGIFCLYIQTRWLDSWPYTTPTTCTVRLTFSVYSMGIIYYIHLTQSSSGGATPARWKHAYLTFQEDLKANSILTPPDCLKRHQKYCSALSNGKPRPNLNCRPTPAELQCSFSLKTPPAQEYLKFYRKHGANVSLQSCVLWKCSA